MSLVDVRGFVAGDREAVRDISYRTGFMGESAESFWRHKDSWADLWTSYYTDREPQSLYVATMDDSVVGYLDTAAMTPSTERWLDRLREVDSPGCHLLTLLENRRALRFFEKMGFRKHGDPTLVGGMRGKDSLNPQRDAADLRVVNGIVHEQLSHSLPTGLRVVGGGSGNSQERRL